MRCLNGTGFFELANHLIATDHTFNKTTRTSLLHKNDIGIRLDNLEALEIKKSLNLKLSDNLLNNQTNLSYSLILNIFPINPSEPIEY